MRSKPAGALTIYDIGHVLHFRQGGRREVFGVLQEVNHLRNNVALKVAKVDGGTSKRYGKTAYTLKHDTSVLLIGEA